MADENTNGALRSGSNSQTNPATEETNSRSIVHNGVATFTIDGTSTDVKLKEGQIGCFSNTDYSIVTTGMLKRTNYLGNYIWGCSINGIDYIFDNNGHCNLDEVNESHPENETHHLWIVSSSIDIAEGSVVRGSTRAGVGTKVVSVDSLTVRDQFALVALEALIHKMNDPIGCSNASIRYVTDKAYVFANAMMISSATARVAAGEDTPSTDSPGTVEVDASTLSNNTEKLLNNIHKAIEASTSKLNDIKVQEAAKFSSGVKVDNPTNDKFQVEGAGEGGDAISYEDIPLLTETGQTTMSHVLGFATDSENDKYLGKLSFATFANKIFTAITTSIRNLIDSRGTTNIGSGGAWNSDLTTLIDGRITTKVKSEALNS